MSPITTPVINIGTIAEPGDKEAAIRYAKANDLIWVSRELMLDIIRDSGLVVVECNPPDMVVKRP